MTQNANNGNCYVASEALYHLLGGKKAGWTPQVLRVANFVYAVNGRKHYVNHWYLKHSSGLILDPTRDQFGPLPVNYSGGRGTGFLTKQPSKRAVALMQKILWQS